MSRIPSIGTPHTSLSKQMPRVTVTPTLACVSRCFGCRRRSGRIDFPVMGRPRKPAAACLGLFLFLLVSAVGLQTAHGVVAGETQTIPEVPFVVLRVGYFTYEIRHAYSFVQPYRKSLPPQDFGQIGDVFTDHFPAVDFGYNEIHSRLTGQRVFRATSVWSGAGVLEWPTDAQETGFSHGSPPADPEIFSWWPTPGFDEAGARAAWASARDLDVVAELAAQGDCGVFVFRHQYGVPSAGELIVIVYGRPPAPRDMGITRLVWPRTLMTRFVNNVPEADVHNFSDEPLDVDVQIELRSGDDVVHTSTRTIEALEADSSRRVSFDAFVPRDFTPLRYRARLLAHGDDAWEDAFSDNDRRRRKVKVTDHPVFRVVGSLREPGAIPLDGDMVDFDGDGDLDVIKRKIRPVFWQNDGTGHYRRINWRVNASFHAWHRRALVRDFTGDDRPDVLVEYFQKYPILLRGDGSGAFQEITGAAGLTGFDTGRGLEALDLDGDGDQDVILRGSAQETVLLNNGTGHFTDGSTGSGLDDDFGQTEWIASGRLDADDAPEIVMVNWWSPPAVYWNKGDGLYSRVAILGEEDLNRMAVVLDHDRDGINDVLVASNYGNRLYRHSGFFDFEDVTAGAGDVGAAFFADGADIDGDGWTDLVLSEINALRLVLNEAGRFTEQTELLVDMDEHLFCCLGTDPRARFVDFDADGDLDIYSLSMAFENLGLPRIEAAIDIRPGSDENHANPHARGVIPVALLGSEILDVLDVDTTTLTFGVGNASLAHANGPHVGDVNGDGLADLLCHFSAVETGIAPGGDACLAGETLDGIPVEGCDTVLGY